MATAPKSRIFEAYNSMIEDDLTTVLAEYRADGLTYDQIVAALETDYGMKTSRSAVQRWLNPS